MDAILQTIDVAVAIDQNYVTPFCALISSIQTSNKGISINIHCFATGISEAELFSIADYCSALGMSITYHKINENDLKDLIIPKNTHFTKANYYRLFFPDILSRYGVTRFIYLDVDIIIVGDLTEFYKISLENKPVAAVRDYSSIIIDAKKTLGIPDEFDYFNSGVLLIDVNNWIEHDVTSKSIEYTRRNPEKIRLVDQDSLNAVLIGNWVPIDTKYNTIPNENEYSNLTTNEINEILSRSIVIHFAGPTKPWSILSSSKLKYLYFSSLKQAPEQFRKKYLDFNTKTVLFFLANKFTFNKLEYIYSKSGVLKFIWRKIKQGV